jgi:DUF3096 family protein
MTQWGASFSVALLEKVLDPKVTKRTSLAERIVGENSMYLHVSLQPLIGLIAGLLILMIPRLLNYIVALYLIIIGIVGLMKM